MNMFSNKQKAAELKDEKTKHKRSSFFSNKEDVDKLADEPDEKDAHLAKPASCIGFN